MAAVHGRDQDALAAVAAEIERAGGCVRQVTGDVTINFVRNTLNRGISNNDNTGTSPLYIFGYTPSFINLNSKDAAGNYTTNIFNCPVCSNPFQTFALLKATEDVWRGIGS